MKRKSKDTPALKKLLEKVENFNRDWFIKFEEILHKANNGPMWMKDERVADAVADSLQKLDGDAYRLDAYAVMSNHVHVVFKPFLSQKDLQEILIITVIRSSPVNIPAFPGSCSR